MSLSYADRAKKANTLSIRSNDAFPDIKSLNGDPAQPSSQKPSQAVNVWRQSHQRLSPSTAVAPHRSSESLQNGANRLRKDIPLNGLPPSLPDVADDPFVVRVPPQLSRAVPASAQPPPSIDDTDSWPEVGKLSVAGSNSHNTPPVETPRDSNRPDEDNREPIQGTSPLAKRSEKTKWVAIPAEELQAAADALHASTRQPHSRSQWHKQGNGSRNNQTSGSGSAQGPSRSHSGRNSLSHSVSQSQVHSRTGSVQSSPPRTNRAKKLPTDEPVGARSALTGSTASSPHPPSADGSEPSSTAPTVACGPDHDRATAPVPTAVQATSYPQDNHQISLPSPSHSSYNLPNPSGYGPAPPLPAPGPTYPLYPPYSQPYTHYVSEQQRLPYPPTFPPLPSQPDRQQQPLPAVSVSQDSYIGADPPQDAQRNQLPEKRAQPVVFGSIGLPGSSKGPVPSPTVDDEKENDVKGSEHGSVEKRAKTFSVGLFPGESGPSRSRVNKGRKRVETVPARSSNDVAPKEKDDDNSNPDRSVIDLTRKEIETEWEFGSIKSSLTDNLADADAPSEPAVPTPSPSTNQLPLVDQAPQRPADPSQPRIQTGSLTLQHRGQLASPINILPMAAPFPVQRAAMPLPVTDGNAVGGSEWEVKDYGFGFGHGGPPNVPFEERDRDRERLEREWADMERERERQREQEREREFNGRPRRGSYGGGGAGGGGGYSANYGGRRGRGMNTAFSAGRGFHPRGGRGVYPSQQQRQPPFTITPPPQFQPLSAHNDIPSAYYAPPRPTLATYIPTSYESYQVPPPVSTPSTNMPPVPVPLSVLSFPLDPTRWYLLGQLEYYLSPQNMAQDFFLRQKMDSRGWIPIALISSFNRVRLLTVDPSLVREVLVLSTVVEVKDDWVRMSGWEQFVLPNAAKSEVEDFAYNGSSQAEATNADGELEDGDGEADGEEEEEEEVEFVMERRPESPERRDV